MPYEISIPERAKTGSVLEIVCNGYVKGKTAFAGIMGKDPSSGTYSWHGKSLPSYISAKWIQAEQENSPQEIKQKSFDDGRIHFELFDAKGKPLAPGKYVIHAVAYSNQGLGKGDKIQIVEITA